MQLKYKMSMGAALIAVLPVAITAYLLVGKAGEIGDSALQGKARSHIISIRDSKKQQIEDYFKLVTNQIEHFSSDPTTIAMMQGFKLAYPDFLRQVSGSGMTVMEEEEGPPVPGEEEDSDTEAMMDTYRTLLEEYYSYDFTEEYEILNADPPPNMVRFLQEKLNDNAIALQYYYIVNNPNPLGTKEEFNAAQDNSIYTQLHRAYHPTIRDYMNRFVFQDVYLVDADSGNVVYSVLKQLDFGTSLIEGPYADTGLAQVFNEVNQAGGNTPDFVSLVDFTPYLPAYQNQAAFIASPIYDENRKIGVAIFQLAIDRVNDIMTYDRSWRLDESGRTGEAIIVASDNTLRNDSRFLVEDREAYLSAVEATEMLSQEVINTIKLKDTSVGLQKMDNTGTRNAFSGIAGFDTMPDYRGEMVLSAYAPINVAGLNWAIFSNLSDEESYEQLAALTDGIQQASYNIAVVILVLGIVLGALLSFFVARPIQHLAVTMTKVAEGDFTARSNIRSKDELGALSKTFNALLDERLTQLAKAERENEMLNNSIIELLKASFQLSQRDLTVQVPVTEDVTGPLADAINQMAQETSKVLLNVRQISEQVASASNQVKVQAENVSRTAEEERAVVATTMTELAAASEAMNKIAEVAQSCNEIAAEATRTTQIALETVTGTVNGMGEIRETIHETEKRIKRLGERSQEISGIVDIINNIAERTHVLALNASMQAAAAGEAGRGFSVVADEVQRLAESSRNATSQISALVKNIQVETNDTIATMDKTIGQVVDGSRLAERAGEQMKETQDTTANLVKVVEQIAMASQQQARISNELREHAQSIQSSSEETGRQLEEQTIQTDRLVEYAQQLIESIGVFKLPTA
jgi:methyl-accepting chemotaxis protein